MWASALQGWHRLASRRVAMVCAMAFVLSLAPWHIASAQDLVITNARIIDATGQTIARGSIAVAGGRILSVTDAIARPGNAFQAMKLLLTDNVTHTDVLARHAEATGRQFLAFTERPTRHWYPGDGIGAAW
jgi:hypothetical protein